MCYGYAKFSSGWDQEDYNNVENVMSRTGYVIKYVGCPVLWCSNLQTEIALSTTEEEYTALGNAIRNLIPFMGMMKEV